MRIQHSVGRRGRNQPDDVQTVRARLVELGFTWADGTPGGPGDPGDEVDRDLVHALRLFQAIKNGHQVVDHDENDGLVEPGQDTALWLASPMAPRWQVLPAGGPEAGYVTTQLTDEGDPHDYCTGWLAETLRAAGASYRDHHLLTQPNAAPLTVNDASLPRGGPTPIHKGHQTGLSCDLRLPRLDGGAGRATWRDPGYDREALRAMMQALWQQPGCHRLFCNDEVLIHAGLCLAAAGHDNHVHFEIRPPSRS